MRVQTRMLAVASTIAMAAGLAVATPARAANPPPVDATTHTVTCNSVIGKVKIDPPLTNTATGAPQTIAINMKLLGCTDNTDSSVSIKQGVAKGTINGTDGGCAGLAGASPASGTIPIKWTTNPGTPKLLNPMSNFTVNGTSNGIFTSNSWGAAYGLFQVGTTFGSGPPSVSGSFQGTDGGATSTFQGTTALDVGAILAYCAGNGLKIVQFGIGGVTLK